MRNLICLIVLALAGQMALAKDCGKNAGGNLTSRSPQQQKNFVAATLSSSNTVNKPSVGSGNSDARR